MYITFSSTDVTIKDPSVGIIDTSTNDPVYIAPVPYKNWKDILNISLSTFILGFLGFLLFFMFDVDIDIRDHSTNHIIPYNSYMYLFIWPLITLLLKYTYSDITFEDYAFFFMFDFTLAIIAAGSIIPIFGVPYTVLADDSWLRQVMKDWNYIFFSYVIIIWLLYCTVFSIFAYFLRENISFFAILYFICFFWHLFVLIYGLKNRDRSKTNLTEPEIVVQYDEGPRIWTRHLFHPFRERFYRFNNWHRHEKAIIRDNMEREKERLIQEHFDPNLKKEIEKDRERRRINDYNKQDSDKIQFDHNVGGIINQNNVTNFVTKSNVNNSNNIKQSSNLNISGGSNNSSNVNSFSRISRSNNKPISKSSTSKPNNSSNKSSFKSISRKKK